MSTYILYPLTAHGLRKSKCSPFIEANTIVKSHDFFIAYPIKNEVGFQSKSLEAGSIESFGSGVFAEKCHLVLRREWLRIDRPAFPRVLKKKIFQTRSRFRQLLKAEKEEQRRIRRLAREQ